MRKTDRNISPAVRWNKALYRTKRSLTFGFVLQRTNLCARRCFMENLYLPKDPRMYLREELQIRKKRRPHYSLRAFARDLEMSPSSLCEFLSGRQGMSRERILWVGKKIQLSDTQIDHFCDLVEVEFGRTPKDRKAAKVRVTTRTKDDNNRMSVEQFHVIADWYHLTLLEILNLPDQNFSINEIAQILNIDQSDVELGLQRLCNLGMLVKVEGKYQVQSDSTVTGDEGPSRAIQIFHEQFLQMQADVVTKKSPSDRENISVSLGIAQKDWPKLREEIKHAVISTLTKYATNNNKKDQVVCFALQAITLLEPKAVSNFKFKQTSSSEEKLNV